MRLYITGISGYLGRQLARLATNNGWQVRGCVHQSLAYPDADVVDLRQRGQATAAISAFAPDAVIHTAYVQSGPDLHNITVLGAIEAAAAAANANARHLHISSDMVFAGTASEYDEIDMPDPITAYGTAKAVAEAGVAQSHPEASIVRTSLLYSAPSQPPSAHEQFALDAANGTREATFFRDEWRCPVLVDEFAQALLILLGQNHRGPLHLVGATAINRYAFACAVVRARGGDIRHLKAGIIADSHLIRPARLILRSSYPNPAWRLRGVDEVLATPH
ncbi:MAG: NAD-dependent epimerase/dehydratase family protein [Chloroflexia bacterium]|nr:NAD-dependent epimerase/dehydratase family protein [Chloroflexia bacterium]